MNLKNEKAWDNYVKNNTDPYGKCIIQVAQRVMELIDGIPVGYEVVNGVRTHQQIFAHPIDAYALVLAANLEITGFMAGAVAKTVADCHPHGEAFRRSWNTSAAFSSESGVKANETPGAVINPALLSIAG